MAALMISLPEAVRPWIDAQIASGSYTDASDYMYRLLLQDQEYHEPLRAALMHAEQSGVSPHTVKDIILAAKSTLNASDGSL